MSLSESAFYVHRALQRFIPLSYRFSNIEYAFLQNPQIRTCKSKLLRVFMLISAIFYSFFPFLRLCWLCSNWRKPIPQKPEQFNINTFIFCLASVALSIYWFTERYQNVLIAVLNQRLQLVPIIPWPEKFSVQKYLVYVISFGTAAFPLSVLSTPLLMDFLPLRLVYAALIRKTTQADNLEYWIFILLEGFSYALTVFFPALAFLSVVLVITVFGEGIQKLTSTLVQRSFQNCVTTHQRVRILLAGYNEVIYGFLFNLTWAGVVLISTCNYTAIKLRHDLPVLAVVAFCTLVALMMIVLFLFTILADIPNRDGKRFHMFWKETVGKSKERSRILKACPKEIGYSVGMMMHVRRVLGLIIADIIVQITVSLLLMK